MVEMNTDTSSCGVVLDSFFRNEVSERSRGFVGFGQSGTVSTVTPVRQDAPERGMDHDSPERGVPHIGQDVVVNGDHTLYRILLSAPVQAAGPCQLTQILRLRRLSLVTPLAVSVELDEGAYLAKALDVPGVFGYADAADEAVQDLKDQLEELYVELQDGSEYSEEWQECLAFLRTVIVQ